MKKLIVIILLATLTLSAKSQEVTFYYNNDGELTIPALATHYRVAKIDSLTKEFDGLSLEYNVDSLLIGAYQYTQGQLQDIKLIISKNDTLRLKPMELEDSLKSIVHNKNSFSQATYIRKNDYQIIMEKLSPIPMDDYVSTDSTMWEGEMVLITEIFTIVEHPASFPGGMNTMVKFLSYFLIYPFEAQNAGIKGKVLVEFIIDEIGIISDVNVTKGIGYGCDEAAAYAVNNLPDWKPGYQRGKPVKVRMTLPITFQ